MLSRVTSGQTLGRLLLSVARKVAADVICMTRDTRSSQSTSATTDSAPEHIGRLLLRAHRMVSEEAMPLVRMHGHPALRIGHLPVFANVDPNGTTITVLAERAGMTKQMMGRLVRELEELGYLRTAPDEEDRRAVIVMPTRRGQQFRRDADEAMEGLIARYEAYIGADTLRTLREGLLKLLSIPRVATEHDEE